MTADPKKDVVAAAPAPPTSGNAATDAAIEAWFAKHFHGHGARMTVEIYNACHDAKEDLKRLLATL